MSDTPQKVTISLPNEAISFIRDEAKRTGLSMADIVRRSIANEKFLHDARKDGADLFLSEPGKATTKLVFR